MLTTRLSATDEDNGLGRFGLELYFYYFCRRRGAGGGYRGLIGSVMEVVYEDNHIIVVNKAAGEIVQGDKTGDKPLSEMVKEYIKVKYSKPGNVFCGVVHRIDRPVSGLVIFAKTSKALERLNRMLRDGEIHKTYRALVEGHPKETEAVLENYLISDGRINKTFVADEVLSSQIADSSYEGAKRPERKTGRGPNKPGEAKLSRLAYRAVARGDRYTLLEINLMTGRKHQIRAQLSHIGCPIKGDLKYGAKRSNPGGGISLQAYRIQFTHPVSKQPIDLTAPPLPDFLPLL